MILIFFFFTSKLSEKVKQFKYMNNFTVNLNFFAFIICEEKRILTAENHCSLIYVKLFASVFISRKEIRKFFCNFWSIYLCLIFALKQ